MPESTCPVCGRSFAPTTANQRFCPPTDRDRIAAKNGQSRSRCAREASNHQQRVQVERARCARCDGDFTRVRGRKAHVYCSDGCHHEAKAQRFSEMYRTARAQWPPEVKPHDMAKYKRSLRVDPCAYCGESPSGGIDHIEPTLGTGDRKDWANLTGCCKSCNETKRALPLLLALPWIPLSREYHAQRRALYSASNFSGAPSV